jgi:hypothetical protein
LDAHAAAKAPAVGAQPGSTGLIPG